MSQLAFTADHSRPYPCRNRRLCSRPQQPYLRGGRLSTLRLSTRPDAIDGEALARLHRYGVSTIELGAQSMDERVLAGSPAAGHTAQDVVEASREIKSAGFKLILQMMTGLPGSGRRDGRGVGAPYSRVGAGRVRVYRR